MGLNLNLFVHGVPKGQKIWGPQEDDRNYIESFYGRKTNVDVQLIIEVIQSNENVNCYYTYFRNGDISDNDNRPGAYFALTVRSNAYYGDLANMYNILDAAYQKFFLGTIIKSNASATKFIVQDFDLVNKQLQDVEKEIIHYLGSFSIDSDFVDLKGFKTNSKNDTGIINLLDCNSITLLDYLKTKGNLSVSPLHPTIQVSEITQRKNDEIENVKSQLQMQISTIKNEAAQKIKEVRDGYEEAIKAIRSECASANKTITDLKKQLETEKSKGKELDKANQIFSSIKHLLSNVNEVATTKGIPTIKPKDENNTKKTVLEKFSKFHPLVDMIVMLILVMIIAISSFKSPSSDQTFSEKLNNIGLQIEQLSNKIDETEKLLTQQPKVNTIVPEISNSNENSAVYSDAKIDIKELGRQNPNMNLGKKYYISIKNAAGGRWKSDDFTINGDSIIIPKKLGDCTIDYVINNKVIKSRTIKVVN